jgi:hypothetical protein
VTSTPRPCEFRTSTRRSAVGRSIRSANRMESVDRCSAGAGSGTAPGEDPVARRRRRGRERADAQEDRPSSAGCWTGATPHTEDNGSRGSEPSGGEASRRGPHRDAVDGPELPQFAWKPPRCLTHHRLVCGRALRRVRDPDRHRRDLACGARADAGLVRGRQAAILAGLLQHWPAPHAGTTPAAADPPLLAACRAVLSSAARQRPRPPQGSACPAVRGLTRPLIHSQYRPTTPSGNSACVHGAPGPRPSSKSARVLGDAVALALAHDVGRTLYD